MNVWCFIDPTDPVNGNWEPMLHFYNDAGIIREYYPSWLKLMEKVQWKGPVREQDCIDDFVVVTWAWKVSCT